jgi:hypothetical protein
LSCLDEPAKALKAGDHGVPGGENMLADRQGRVRYFTIREMIRLATLPGRICHRRHLESRDPLIGKRGANGGWRIQGRRHDESDSRQKVCPLGTRGELIRSAEVSEISQKGLFWRARSGLF